MPWLGELSSIMNAVVNSMRRYSSSPQIMAWRFRTVRDAERTRPHQSSSVKTNMLSAGLVYLKNMRAQVDGGDPNRLVLRLVDANTEAPVSNASVVCVTCEPETRFETGSKDA